MLTRSFIELLSETNPAKKDNRHNLINSIKLNLEYLFTHKQDATLANYELTQPTKTLLSYGMPNLIQFDLSNPHDRTLLCSRLNGLIAAFEPRLTNCCVKIDGDNYPSKEIAIVISADINFDNTFEQVIFNTVLTQQRPKVNAVNVQNVKDASWN